ncbi:Rha family transcriptional regulator [Streptococcus equi subsp. zooepidemicus]|uniref:Rha family transcriptional regulator n=1 Tax=Streptococcus equi TaxID=1336 RepID=UPI0024A93949|nr:Rha family transcriptional regulator [Streptococcus equi]MDI5952790.1 Rha family transcriptional regulator [Streptococcus equi subsp. zooepidemicus]MDI6073636.1 Rha family transcriptional regulator [Streptococcus equi subsp. zooepidemicus]
MNIVYLDDKKEPYTTSEIIAECAEVQHHTITRLVREHKVDFEALGILGFEIHKLDTRGQPKKSYILNEQQATLLITYLKNTEPVREFKKNLVKAFFELRKEVAEFRYQRALEKPKRKELTKAIDEWPNAPKHAHSTVTNLLLKAVTGFNAKQIKALRGGKIALNQLYSGELKEYIALENMVIALIELDFSYDDIKKMVNKKTHLAGA